MAKKQNMELEYLRQHRWGIVIDGELYKEFASFDEAADEFEAMGGVFPEAKK